MALGVERTAFRCKLVSAVGQHFSFAEESACHMLSDAVSRIVFDNVSTTLWLPNNAKGSNG